MAHRMAKLNVFGRQLLVARVEQAGWTAAAAAEAQGVSRATAYKWVRRYRDEGEDGLLDRSSRPHHSPRLLPADQVELIVRPASGDGTGLIAWPRSPAIRARRSARS